MTGQAGVEAEVPESYTLISHQGQRRQHPNPGAARWAEGTKLATVMHLDDKRQIPKPSPRSKGLVGLLMEDGREQPAAPSH